MFQPRPHPFQPQPLHKEANMSVNWSNVGSTLSGLSTALGALGVTPTNMGAVLSAIGTASNPNKSAEIAICAQLLQFAGQPAVESELAMRLATEQGIPVQAASLALTLTQPGTDIPTRVLQIEQLINQGG